MDINAIKELLAALASNPETKALLKAALADDTPTIAVEAPPVAKTAAGWTPDPKSIGPLPALDSVTYAQVAFCDNGTEKRGPKGRPTTSPRHKAIVELWTVPPERISKRVMQFKRNVDLRGASEFIKLIEGQVKKGSINQDYFDFLMTEVMAIPFNQRERTMFGQISENFEGFRYIPFQYVLFESKPDDQFECVVVSAFDSKNHISITEFSDKFAVSNIKRTGFLDVGGKYKDFKEKQKG